MAFDDHEIFGARYHEYADDEPSAEYVESLAEREADDMGFLSREDMK